MVDIEIMQALLMRLKYEQNLGLGHLPRNVKLTQEIKKQRTEQLNNAQMQKLQPTENVNKTSETTALVKNPKVDATPENIADEQADVRILTKDSAAETKVKNNSTITQREDKMDSPLADKEQKMQELIEQIMECSSCDELIATRDKIVPGAGNINSPLMFIGEAPGADENREGIPFIGRAGKKLTEIIEKGLEIPRSEVFITNVLKCRPPRNRDPKPDEIAFCEQFLRKQIEIMNPKVIFTLGAYAARFMLEKPPTYALAKIRGTLHPYRDTNIKIAATYHPSYLIQYYTKVNRQKVYDDTQMVLKYLKDEGIYPWW